MQQVEKKDEDKPCEDEVSCRQKRAVDLKTEAETLLQELWPLVRSSNDITQLKFCLARLNRLLDREEWSVHTRFLRAEVLSCRHVTAIAISRI